MGLNVSLALKLSSLICNKSLYTPSASPGRLERKRRRDAHSIPAAHVQTEGVVISDQEAAQESG